MNPSAPPPFFSSPKRPDASFARQFRLVRRKNHQLEVKRNSLRANFQDFPDYLRIKSLLNLTRQNSYRGNGMILMIIYDVVLSIYFTFTVMMDEQQSQDSQAQARVQQQEQRRKTPSPSPSPPPPQSQPLDLSLKKNPTQEQASDNPNAAKDDAANAGAGDQQKDDEAGEGGDDDDDDDDEKDKDENSADHNNDQNKDQNTDKDNDDDAAADDDDDGRDPEPEPDICDFDHDPIDENDRKRRDALFRFYPDPDWEMVEQEYWSTLDDLFKVDQCLTVTQMAVKNALKENGITKSIKHLAVPDIQLAYMNEDYFRRNFPLSLSDYLQIRRNQRNGETRGKYDFC